MNLSTDANTKNVAKDTTIIYLAKGLPTTEHVHRPDELLQKSKFTRNGKKVKGIHTVLLLVVLLAACGVPSMILTRLNQVDTNSITMITVANHHPPTGWTPQSSAVACPAGAAENIPPDLFKSQFGEDKLLMQWFGKLCNGTYAEMGALNGVKYSNTHVFHHGLGWKGLLLEASPTNYEKLIKNRPAERELAVVHAGVCAESSALHWVEGNRRTGATGGFWEFASSIHKDRYFMDKKTNGSGAIIPKESTLVQCQPLKDILHQHLGDHVFFDFLSLDIEGAEYAALQTLDFTKVAFGIIMVEASGQDPMKDMAVRMLLESQGYHHYKPESDTNLKKLESDFFVNKDWGTIYKDLIYA